MRSTDVFYRCIVTGHKADGTSTCLEQRQVSEGPGWMHDMWVTSSVPADNAASVQLPKARLAPPPGGAVFRYFKIPPDAVRQALGDAEIERTLREIGGDPAVTHEHPRNQMWHRTDTVDYVVLLQGQAILHLDDGDVPLRPLDCVVQRGTHHAWSNPGDTEALCLCVLIDAVPLAIADKV